MRTSRARSSNDARERPCVPPPWTMLPGGVRVLVFSVLVILALCSRARAGPADASDSEVVILVDPGSPALSRRLEEEIETLELSVRVVREGDPQQSLESLARGAHAV